MKRFICVFAVLLILLTCFTSCNTDDGTSTTQPPETEEQYIVIIEDGKPVYSLVRPDMCTDEVTDVFLRIKAALNDIGGTDIRPETDWFAPGKEPAADSCEILVGPTNRTATSTVASSIGCGDYTVNVTDDNKIVIMAYDAASFSAAADAFIAGMSQITVEGKSLVVYRGGDVMYHAAETYLFGDGSLDKYRIVYSADGANKDAANTLVKAIKKEYNVVLPVVTDAETATSYEIVIGKTTREVGSKYYGASQSTAMKSYEYALSVLGNSLFIGGADSAMTAYAVDAFINVYIDDTSFPTALNLPADTDTTGVFIAGSDPNTLAEGANARIMSFNILSEEWDKAAVMEGRDVRVAATLMYYSPDVAGVQEVSTLWYSRLADLIGDTYVFVGSKIPSGQDNYTSLLYNKDKVKLIETDMILFSVGNSTRLRLLCWGLFESLDNGARFIVTNTHWDPNLSGVDHTPQRLIHADEMADEVLKLKAKYNVPIYSTGDYNCSEDSEPFKNFIAKSGFFDAKSSAVKIGRACKTTHTLGSAVSTSTVPSIDHITVSDKDTLVYYNTLIGESFIMASDHCPIYIDIKLNK